MNADAETLGVQNLIQAIQNEKQGNVVKIGMEAIFLWTNPKLRKKEKLVGNLGEQKLAYN